MANLGFVGLGAMGSRVVKRLLDAGHTVTGYNRTQSKAQWLLDQGMRWGETPRAVAEAADIIFTMVSNTAALHEVTRGESGILAGLGKGKIYVDMSTISPAASQKLAAQVAEKGAHMLDSPVSGSVITLEQGNLSLMVGGDKAIFEQVQPVLLDIGPKVNYLGPNGLAVLMKIAINLNLQVQMMAFCEGLLLAEKGGIPRETALEVMLNTVIASPSLKYRTPFILAMPDEAWFNVNMMQKDMLLALEMGRALDVPLPTTAISNEYLTTARAMGLAEQDFAIIHKVLAKLSGLDA
ncbi:MAG TPA: NAD(P)-dependent oxidoreductase [Ktedonobacteraceae bacterium]|nr:NAD(P)-dependent oxidoreductase [Ktedonobacteraceae bacterium]